MWPFRPKCPVDAERQNWVEQRMEWLANQFGMETWRMARAVEPTEQFFPDRYDGSEEAVRDMLDRVCGYMGARPGRVELRLYTERTNLARRMGLPLESKDRGSAGLYRAGDKEVVAIETSGLGDPMALAATMAHELSHVRLLGEGRVTGEEEDHEPLTDLATVFFGMGVFTANSTFRYSQWTRGGWQGWSTAKHGYLDERTLSYALGLWMRVRGEEKPPWLRHLKLNPRSYTRQAIRFLQANPPVVCGL